MQAMPSKPLTTTHFALLSLLSAKDWTAYELVGQMGRSVGAIWPRAQSNLYNDLKRLADEGFASTTVDHVGKRARTTYTITDDGLTALRAWLVEPGASPTFECEALLKLSFAPATNKTAALKQIDVIEAHARERVEFGRMLAQQHVDGTAPLLERMHINAVMWRYLWDTHTAVLGWAEWARAEVSSWPDTKDRPSQRERGRQILVEAITPPAS